MVGLGLAHLFRLNWIAKSVMMLMALLVRDSSIWMTPARREKVPEISRPLAFMAGSHTWKVGQEQPMVLLEPHTVTHNSVPITLVQKLILVCSTLTKGNQVKIKQCSPAGCIAAITDWSVTYTINRSANFQCATFLSNYIPSV